VEFPGLPEKRDKPVTDFLRVSLVAFQFSPQEPFFEQDAHSHRRERNACQQSSGIRFQPQGYANHHEGVARIQRMSHDAVDSGIDYRVLSLFLMLHRQRREGVLPKGEVGGPPTRDRQCKPQRRNERSGLPIR